MTLLETRPVTAPAAPVDVAPPPVAAPELGAAPVQRPGRVLVAALLATSAAGWMAGGVFVELLARLVAVLAGAAGVGGIALAVQRRRVVLQYALVPAGFVL